MLPNRSVNLIRERRSSWASLGSRSRLFCQLPPTLEIVGRYYDQASNRVLD